MFVFTLKYIYIVYKSDKKYEQVILNPVRKYIFLNRDVFWISWKKSGK